MLTEDYGLLDPATTANADKIAALLDSAKQWMRQIAIINKLIAQELQSSTKY